MKLKIIFFTLAYAPFCASSEQQQLPVPPMPVHPENSIIDRALISCDIPYDATEEEMQKFRKNPLGIKIYPVDVARDSEK
ncbi:hypothetical protein A3J41_02500 [candidate division TM6 bacterium RIFCSPHIGHO2_12_FULL_38_8]|nr:MAG: hypothetical protein A3J41_02500 [candidate division TM6 bacterium RIFCSPHIGHO2_12_FULL_38_8]